MRDMTRTKEALAAYDASDRDPDGPLAEAVGVAYGLDTVDINNPETCRACVRPGKPLPAGHPDEPFLRRMVRELSN